ncbi:hypothetical protein C8A03DRAFT_41532 [Achaetomium macrosporum]|uniref:Uncharacterized protein n=1 Tax=Achaetomium macrosporum TaxID=79813 RepID=A0AAN7CGT0_9PEZI|nr:hypothetical protein C8A03DRAFT_41532 [Achaetomium macrosporum]
MATFSATDTATSFSSSFASQQHKESAAPIINCPVPGCSAKIDAKRQVICEAHLRSISTTDRGRDAPQETGSRTATAPPGTSSSVRQPMPSPNPNPRKLLQEIDKDRPMILRRKTAGNPPQFIPRQPIPIPKHSTPPSRSGPTLSPPSPQPLAPPPPVHSPPASPVQSRNGEPARKRQRLSPSPGHSPKGRVNGTISSRPSSAESGQGIKPGDSGSPQLGRHSSNGSPQRPDGARARDGKSTLKPSAKHPVRRMPLQLSNLRFIDSVEGSTSGVLSEQSSSGLNGWPRNVSRWSDGEAVFALRKGLKGSWTENMGNPTRSVAQVDATDTLREARRTSDLPNGYSQKAPPPKETSDERPNTPGPLLAKGCVVSKQPKLFPQTGQTPPVRPAPIAKIKQPVVPNRKEIDVAHFDALIYSQSGAAAPPPGVELATIEPPAPPKSDAEIDSPEDEPLYLDIDPRIHWPQPHSEAWHAAKQREIRARGTKKANFGRAAESLRRQRQEMEKQGVSFEDTLPEKILENPAWVRVLRRLNGLPPSKEEENNNTPNGNGNGNANGVEGQEQGQGQGQKEGSQQKKGRKPGGITGKKVGAGMVVVTGLNGVELKKRLGDGLALKKRLGGKSNQE